MKKGKAHFVPEPDWLPGLIVYQIAPKGFTSPQGPESGTFRSLTERIPYLHDLGITGIWLAGHNWAGESHFYNIWSSYATIRPDVLDDRLGTERDFKELINTAHANGIRVFLDATIRGVLDSSPLIKEHPLWFSGRTWGGTDYDWFGDHEDLFAWWVDTWVNYVVKYGVDGYRLDISMYRPDLWQEVRHRAFEAGHPIAIFLELGPGRRGVLDFSQWDIRLKWNREKLDKKKPLLMGMPLFIRKALENELPDYQVIVDLEDGTKMSTSNAGGRLRIENMHKESRDIVNPRTGGSYGEDLVILEVTGIPEGAQIADIAVRDPEYFDANDSFGPCVWKAREGVAADYKLNYERKNERIVVRFSRRTVPEQFLSLQLSCHDDGWEGFDCESNPYVAQGSRFVFGYACLLTPTVPIFMSGEEFDADFVPLPNLSTHLFGAKNPGRGTWLYGSWLQWDQLKDQRHSEMLDDVRSLISLRKRYGRLISPLKRESPIRKFFELPDYAPRTSAMPYCYCDDSTLLFIAGNPSSDNDITAEISIPLDALPLRKCEEYRIRDVWNDAPEQLLKRESLKKLTVHVPRDNRRRGGLAVWEISPV